MAKEIKEVIDAPMPGEAWTHPPGTMPWDRPPEFANLNQALDHMFKRFTNPVMAKQLLNIVDTGMPIDTLVESLLMDGFTRGKYGAPILPQMAGPVTVMLWRMAESADVTPRVSTDPELRGVDFDPSDFANVMSKIENNTANKAIHANEISAEELRKPDLENRSGFFKRGE